MTYRDNDDDTSAGKTTQGGGAPRRGNAIWWVLAAVVIAVAVAVAVLTLPRKHSIAEQGTTPVSSTMNVTAPGSVAPSAVPVGQRAATAPSVKP